jgi:hypothetical protein
MKYILLGALAVPVFIIGGMFASSIHNADAAQTVQGSQRSFQRAQHPMHNETVESALEAGDYQAFVAAHTDGDVMLEKITEDNFTKFIEMYTLRKSGDFEGAQAIADELGLPEPQMRRGDKFFGNGEMNPGAHRNEAAELALENGDYQAFVAAHNVDDPILVKITEENFSQFAQMHTLMKEGKFDEVKAIAQELGFPDGPKGKGLMEKHGKQFKSEGNSAAKAALSAGDYQAFVAAHDANDPILQKISEENFAQFAQMHQLMQSGDTEGARALATKLGLPQRGPRK